MAELLISSIEVAGAGTDGDGFGTIEVYATETTNADGATSVTFRVTVGDDWNTNYNLDLNALFLDYVDGGSTKLTVDGQKSLNLNGTTDTDGNKIDWDIAESSGSNAGADGGTTVMEFSVTVDNLSLADIDGDLIGLRATSTGFDSQDSLKLVGEIVVPVEETTDSYPEFQKDISHATLVFNTTSGDTSGDGYYTVKIDNWEGSNDLDADLAAIIAWLVENDPNITQDTELLGAQLKGGSVGNADGSYDDFWANDGSPDTTIVEWEKKAGPNTTIVTEVASTDSQPTGLDLEQNGTLNGSDETYLYEDVFGTTV